MKNFAVTGVAGYVAPRHLKAIRDTGNRLVAALDPHDSVGILDHYSPHALFFSELERFDRYLEKCRRDLQGDRIHYLSICSPNYVHDNHIRLALRLDADAICEKPLVLNPWNLDALEELEERTGRQVYTILQLRVHPSLLELKSAVSRDLTRRHQVCLTYVTSRGPWYHYSWKGDPERSGGLVTNIGIHFFDLLIWLFGSVRTAELHYATEDKVAGFLELDRADVTWFLSIDSLDLPFELKPGCRSTFRSVTVDGQEVEFSSGFSDLHTRVYEETLLGRGFGIQEARPSIELVYALRTSQARKGQGCAHPLLQEVAR